MPCRAFLLADRTYHSPPDQCSDQLKQFMFQGTFKLPRETTSEEMQTLNTKVAVHTQNIGLPQIFRYDPERRKALREGLWDIELEARIWKFRKSSHAQGAKVLSGQWGVDLIRADDIILNYKSWIPFLVYPGARISRISALLGCFKFCLMYFQQNGVCSSKALSFD